MLYSSTSLLVTRYTSFSNSFVIFSSTSNVTEAGKPFPLIFSIIPASKFFTAMLNPIVSAIFVSSSYSGILLDKKLLFCRFYIFLNVGAKKFTYDLTGVNFKCKLHIIFKKPNGTEFEG